MKLRRNVSRYVGDGQQKASSHGRQRDGESLDAEHEEDEESASKIGCISYNLKCNSNIDFQYKTNVNKMMLTLTSVFFKKPMLTCHTLTSIFRKPMLMNIG